MEAFTFVDISSMSKATSSNLHPQSDLAQTTTNTVNTTQPKVMNVVHREIDGDRISTLNKLANAVPSLPSIASESTSTTSQTLDNSTNDEVSYHSMSIDEPDVAIPELDDMISNQPFRRQVLIFHW